MFALACESVRKINQGKLRGKYDRESCINRVFKMIRINRTTRVPIDQVAMRKAAL